MPTRIARTSRGLLVALPLLAACYSYRSTAYSQLAPREFVHVVADSGFVMLAQHFNTATQQDSCRLTRAEGTLLRVSADTVWLAPLAFVQPMADESTACRHLGSGFTTRDAGVDLRVMSSRIEWRRTRTRVFWTLAAVTFIAANFHTEELTAHFGIPPALSRPDYR